MTGGSLQLRLYRRARRDGLSAHDAAALARIMVSEAVLIDKDDARERPAPEAYTLPLGMARSAIGAGFADTPLGSAAVARLTSIPA